MTEAIAIARPTPVADSLSQGFWDAASRGELAIQRCAECKLYQHPPRAQCRGCGGGQVAYERVSGEGKLWSWTLTHRSVLGGLDAALPYTCMIIELNEQPELFVISDLIGREELRGQLKVGLAMRAIFPPTSDGPVLPQFEPASGARS